MKSKVLSVLADRVIELGSDPRATPGFNHWRYGKDEDGIGWLIIDRQGSSANTLSAEVIDELDRLLVQIARDLPKGLVLRSAKQSGFIAGADVAEFVGAKDEAQVETVIGRAHVVIDRLEALSIPTVAVIHGFCLGGGLEVALACKRRIAISGASFGFPEVMLGLHPGLGGTMRTPLLINPIEAMTMMLTGKAMDARRAKAVGLVDAVTEERHVKNAVRAVVAGDFKPAKPGALVTLLNSGLARPFLAKRMRSQARSKADPAQYPAPFALIDL